MYGFIHCCLEDMVLQLFGEAAWREILNVAGIKLRGASFLMHQVYDDETTFKLVVAASQVSGLPMEACLEAFGRHFLVYCQKNGYDQILRVLGSNLYDFLTNLDNLHDHLASIYPGMRAPSFRVTRNLESNGGGGAGDQSPGDAGSVRLLQVQAQQQQQQQHRDQSEGEGEHNDTHISLAAGSMYLHYYSERNGLSPIVKGLVLAVAKEFFSTDIVVTECKLLRPQLGHADDHVVLKIDRRSQVDMLLDEQTSQAVELAAALAAASSPASSSGQAQQVSSPSRTPVPAPRPPADPAQAELARSRLQQSQQQQRTMLMSAIYGDSLSKLASDSLINSEIVMQTFPFHVIFDRHFNLVQVGNALLRVTSFYWMRRQKQRKRPTSGSAACKPDDLVKFSDLFSIVRPKIEFTFDAIADHTNQVFVVKTRPLVLNADYLRSVAGQSEDGADVPSGVCSATVTPTSAKPPPGGGSLCPMNRMAMKRRSCAPRLAIEREHSRTSTAGEDHEGGGGGGGGGDDDQKTNQSPQEPAARQGRHQASSVPSPSHGHENDSGGEYSAFNLLSLRLKGQMIILSGPMGQQQPPAQTQTQTPTQTQTQSDQINQDRQRPAASPWQPQGPFCLYLCSPRVDHLDQLMECGVKMSDLALHDRARELMLMSHTHKEDREAVKKLDQATNDLKKMDTKLRQENKRTNEVLHNIFPAKIATLLSHGTKIESESFDPVTCLYSDIIGFTKMCGSENVRPIDIVRLLNTLYLQFDNLTNIHGVYKVETIGDAYVIVGGLPEPVEDHADRCVRMGLDMVKVIATVRSPADNEPIQMRIGIHSGPVMAGIVGIRVPRYSLFGNTTTLANQLEAHGVGGKIHISDFTLKNLIKRDRFVIEDNAKQISGFPFKTYFVTNYLSDEKELLKHEKILEEQLIRDFELMGNEVELVEDNSGHSGATAQLRARIATRGQLAANSTQRQRQQQQQQHDSTSCQNQNSQQPKQGAQDQESQVHEPREQVKSKAIVLMDVEGAYLRPLSADGQQPGGQREGVSRKQSREKRRKMPTRELVEMSCKLSDEILEDAVRQFADLQTLDRLLALLASRQMGLNSHIGWGSGYKMDAKATRLKLPPLAGFIPTPKEEEEQPQKQQQQQQEAQGSAAQSNLAPANQQPERPTQAGGSCCPFCLGDGRLQLDDGGLQQVKLVAAAVSVALTSIGSIKFPSGGGIGNSQQQQHPNERFTRFFNLLINNPTLSGGSANVMTIKTQAASSVCQTKPLDGQTSSGTSPAATSTASQTPDSKQRWSSGAADTMAGSSNTPRGGSITRAAAAAAQVQGANEGLRDSNSETEEQPLVDGLQIILSNLRLEREKLSTQVERLADQLKELGRLEPITTTTSGRPKEDSIETAEDEDEARFPLMLLKLQQQQQQQQAATADGLSGALAKPVGVPCGFNLQNRSPLSSNIHRMRRMDTLKRRKIKREEQSQQQQSQYSALTSPLSSASSTICETPNTSTCRTLSSPTSRGEQKTWTRKEALTRTMSSGGGRPGCSSEPIIESDDEENDGSVKVVAAAAAAAAGPNPTSRPMAAPGGQRSNEQISRSQDTARSRQHPPTPSPPSATYIYQSFRSSLASLMNETVSQTLAQAQQEPNANELRRVQNQQKLNQTTSEQQEKRKRFSLSSLGTSLSSAIVSPFLSPKKMAFQQQQQQHVKRVASNEINASERPPALAAASQGDRKSSSPHSSSSNGNQRRQQQQQQQQQQSGRPGSGGGTSALMKQSSNSANNCSCLKSSGSSQSVKSDLR